MEPVKIWSTEEVILKYFFQIVQTKYLSAPYFRKITTATNSVAGSNVKVGKCPTETKVETVKTEKLSSKGPRIIAVVSNKTELLKLAKIIRQYVQAGDELQLFILFCSYDHFFELCLSRGKEEALQMEEKMLEYQFVTAAGLLINTTIECKLIMARHFLSSEPLATPKILSVEPSKQREQIIQMMQKAVDTYDANNAHDSCVGLITFAPPIVIVVPATSKDANPSAKVKQQVKRIKTTDAMFTDIGKNPTTFISWVQLPCDVENYSTE